MPDGIDYFRPVMRRLVPYTVFLFFVFSFCKSLAFTDSAERKKQLVVELVSRDSVSCIIPFNRVGNLMMVKAKVDTIEGNFILDTGVHTLFKTSPTSDITQ